MKLVDLNVLLYVVNRDSVHHDSAHDWWTEALRLDEPVGLTWAVILGFLRLTTNPAIFPFPLDTDTALDKVDNWLSLDQIRLVQETDDHWHILRDLLRQTGSAGNLTSDAHLAALAISHGATLVSFDNDFSRFPKLRWERPSQQPLSTLPSTDL
jgi:toxin-antitoxin system PIN domain toxin